MDAYDIFKKLTVGLTFKKRVLGVKSDVHPPKPTPAAIKKEKEEFDVSKEELEEEIEANENDDLSIKSEVSDAESESQESDDDLQIVEGLQAGQKRKKREKKEKSEGLKKKLELEEQNRFRNEHGIKVVGRHVPAAIQDFSDLVQRYNVSQGLVDTVTQCGYSEPTPVQRQAVPCMLEDRQIFACAPTGSGKTAAFLLPILHTLGAPAGGPRALVLCPTRELALQIYREALRLSAATQLRCSVVRSVKESKVKEREATIRKSDIVISTPNRLCYLLNQDTVNITLDKVRWLIIDEADKLFEGSADQSGDFRQQLDQIMAACGNKQRRVAMFSATHTPPVAKWTRHHMRGLLNITVGQRNAATQLVDQELLYCGNENGKLVAFRQLVQKGLKPPVLVFVQSKDRAKQLFKELIYDGINVDVIHADRTQAQRDNVVRSFRVGRIWVLICTELMGRGIDFRGVNLVINFDFPPSAISYIHRIGRAGRAGQKGRAVTFFTQDDVVNLRSIASVMKQSGCEVPEYMLKLKQNANKRKKLLKRAPHREKISTVLEKRPDKRKIESEKDAEKTETTDTAKVDNAKNKKHRKVENKENSFSKNKGRNEKKGQSKENNFNKNKGRKENKFSKNKGMKEKTLKKKKNNKLGKKKVSKNKSL